MLVECLRKFVPLCGGGSGGSDIRSVGGTGACLRRQHAPIIACRVTELLAFTAIPNTSHCGLRPRKWPAHTPKKSTSLLQATTSCASVCMPLLVRCISCRTFLALKLNNRRRPKPYADDAFSRHLHIYTEPGVAADTRADIEEAQARRQQRRPKRHRSSLQLDQHSNKAMATISGR